MFTSLLQMMRFAMSGPMLTTPGGAADAKPQRAGAAASGKKAGAVKTAAAANQSSKAEKSDKKAAATKAVGRAAGAKPTALAAAPVARKAVAVPAPTTAADDPQAATAHRVPMRSGRPSSRLAQITVPSMAQSVASSAAKSSYTQTTSPSAIIAPPVTAQKKNPKLADNWKTVATDKLSDEEVLAMPDGEYMNDKQTAFFRLKLVRLKADMLSNAGETTEHLREDTVVVPDPADRATIEEEHALELRTRDRERKLLKKIEQSIARIDAGDYGFCDETGEPIGVGRLLARPTATLSLEAQQRRELKQKMFGD